jgi:hypothetical protein
MLMGFKYFFCPDLFIKKKRIDRLINRKLEKIITTKPQENNAKTKQPPNEQAHTT